MPRKYQPAAFRLFAFSLTLLLAACGNMGDRKVPIPTTTVVGSGKADVKTLVIVLPGRRDNVEVLQKFGVAQAIHAGWPQVDVQLTSATMAYYTDGGLARRVRDEILDPARASGYQRIIVMGASMGGMGSLIIDAANPGIIDHLILMAPYLGERELLDEIQAAGGISSWQPGPMPAVTDKTNFQRELWRHIQTFTHDDASRNRVWLAYGEADSLAKTVPVIAPALDAEHLYEREGGHKWAVWNAAASVVFAKLRRQTIEGR